MVENAQKRLETVGNGQITVRNGGKTVKNGGKTTETAKISDFKSVKKGQN